MKFIISSNLIYRNIWYLNEKEDYGVSFNYRYNGPDEISVSIATADMDPESKDHYLEILQNLSPDARHDEISFAYYPYLGCRWEDEVLKKNENFVVYNNFPLSRNSDYVQLDIGLHYVGAMSSSDKWSDTDQDFLWNEEDNKPDSKQISKEYQIIANILLDDSWDNELELENSLKTNHNLLIEDDSISFHSAYLKKF